MTGSSELDDGAKPQRFEPGTHIRVRRFGLYMRHGVYVNDSCVIQFGGGDIWNKRSATICVASLSEFEADGAAEMVVHGKRTGLMPPLPDALPGPEVVRRAEWLLRNYTPGRYHLIGNNCEHAANWCATGIYSESHQVRAAFGLKAIFTIPFFWYFGYRTRGNQPAPRALSIGLAVSSVLGVAAVLTYNEHIRRFWRDIGFRWDASEREGATDDPT